MDAELLQGFIKQAEEYLPLVRGGILVCAQPATTSSVGVYGEFAASQRQIASIRNSAEILGLDRIAVACANFERELKTFRSGAPNGSAACAAEPFGDEDARRLLDKLSELEALVAEVYFGVGDFSDSVSNLVEESFEQFEQNRNSNGDVQTSPNAEFAVATDEFEIDDDMLEVFTLEADELTRNFSRSLEILEKFPAEKSGDALGELRRSAHTLKGAASVVGLKTLAQFAHRVEDLLDCLSETEIAENKRIFELLLAATDCFEALSRDEKSQQLTKKVGRIYQNIDGITAALETKENQSNRKGEARAGEVKEESREPNRETQFESPKSVVRVSLEKLDELVEIAENLSANRSTFAERLTALDLLPRENLQSLFEQQCRLIEQMQEKLLRLRTVRFGSLAARLQRTVRVACEEEDKRAELIIEGADLEIDTQILDGLVEPLLHMLRNAVAHGIEAPDLRRLLGKPETGSIGLRATTENSFVVVRISDDGRGISADALREKAVAENFVSRERAERMSDGEAFELIFQHGLTTAEILSQTAGRGIGMNAVKTGIERRRGTISIESEARKGTVFTVRLPIGTPPSSADENSSLSVLIVDDSPSIRQTTSGLIKRAGWQARTAGNGLEALKILHGAHDPLPDVILTDAEMPQMDGYAFLSALKNQEKLRAIPVVMITSRADEFFRRKAMNLGVSDFFEKPYDKTVLLERIKSLIS